MRILPILLAVCLFVSLQGWTCVEGTGTVLEASLAIPGGTFVSEAIGSFQACVGLSETPNTEVIVTIITEDSTILQTAIAQNDYISVDETFIFANMTTNLTQCVDVVIINDDLAEILESFTIKINESTVLIGASNTVLLIIDDTPFDPIKVEFEESEFSATEGDLVEICATIIQPGPAVREVTLSISTQEITATNGDDYIATNTFVIEEGEMRGCHPISTVPDGRVEYAESLTVSLDSTLEDASGNATVVIIDNDGANVTLVSECLSVEDGNSGDNPQVELCVQVKAAEGPIERAIGLLLNTAEGTADSSDFEPLIDAAFTIPSTTPLGSTVCYNITITGDDVLEVNEMFTVTVSTANDLDVIVGADTATVTVLQKTGELEASLLLPNGSTFGEGFGSFLACVELNESPNDEVTVTIMSAQAPFLPALASEDYVSVNETLTFTNMTSNLIQCVIVEIVNDEVAEESVESFDIVISSNNVPISGTGSQSIIIFDTDLINVDFQSSEFTATEGVTVQVCAVIIPVGPAVRPVELSITTTDITTTGSDYNQLTDFTIPMGEPSACRSLTAIADGVVEDIESLLVSIDSDVEDASGNATVVIIDADGANVTLESEGLSVQERNSGESSQVELCVQVEADRGPLERDVGLLLNTIEGTADTSDFESLTDAAFTVPSTTALGSTVCYNITITGDDVQEVNETFTITVRTVNSLDQIVGADTVNVTILNNGCPMETTVVYSYEDETLDITWPESELGDVIVNDCPCSNLTDSQEKASRMCGGDYTGGVVWQAITSECSDLSDTSIKLCLAAEEGDVALLSEEVEAITVVGDLEPVDITIVSEILENLVESISDTTVRDNTLSTIDNILDEDRSTIAESQEESNATSRILEVIDRFGEIVGLEVDGKATFSRDNFAVHVDETEVDQYSGITFGVDTEIDTLEAFEADSITTVAQEEETNRTGAVSISLPDTLLSDLIADGFLGGDVSSRFSYSVFIDDALFQSLPGSESAAEFRGYEVGSVIVSAAVAGIDRVSDLSKPARMRFQIRQDLQERGRNPRCVFWDTARDGGRGGYSTEGCTMASSTDSDIECECSHLTSFAILLDVSPQEEEEEELALEIITYIGLGISVIALILTITTYLLSKKLRRSENGRLLVNMCVSLLGLFIVFILSGQAEHYPDGLCGFFSALLHYFMLAYFFWTGVEAIFLYLKLVKVFTGTGVLAWNYVWISMAVAWLVPVIIVGISLAGHEYYTSNEFCRPYKWPFWFGFILPFAVIYIFNWIMFLLIMVSLCRHSAKSAGTTKSSRSVVLRHLLIAVVLSLLFGLGWAFGLIGSSSLPEEVFIPAQYIFSIFVGLQGVLIFIFHGIRSPDAREEWRRWWYTVTGRAEQYRVLGTTSTTGTLPRTKNAYTQRQTSATSPTDSFRLASSSTSKVPLSPESEKLADIPLSSIADTSVVLDTIVENPEATADKEKGDLEEGLVSTDPEEGMDEDKTTRL